MPDTSVNFNIDVNAILAAIFGAGRDRNDLLVIVANGTQHTLDVNFRNEHGNFATTDGSSRIEPMTLADGPDGASTFSMGWKAAGVGCNAFVEVRYSDADDRLGVVAATPSNKENYFRWHPYRHTTEGKYGYIEANCGKHYANDGNVAKALNGGVRFNMWITNVSPAVCRIELLDEAGERALQNYKPSPDRTAAAPLA